MENFATDRFPIKKWTIDESTGFLHIPLTPAKVGVMDYPEHGKKRFMSPEVLKDAASSMDYCPFTWPHPPEMIVDANNVQEYQKGLIKAGVSFVTDRIKANAIIQNGELVDAIVNKRVVEVSSGYRFKEDDKPGTYKGVDYDSSFTWAEYNHVAGVDKGRAGTDVKFNMDKKSEEKMTDKIVKITLEAFKRGEIAIDGVEVEYPDSASSAFEKIIVQNKQLKSGLKTAMDSIDGINGENSALKIKVEEQGKQLADTVPKSEVMQLALDFKETMATADHLGVKLTDEQKKTPHGIRSIVVAHMMKDKGQSIAMDSEHAVTAAFQVLTQNLGISKANKAIDDAIATDMAGQQSYMEEKKQKFKNLSQVRSEIIEQRKQG